MGDSGRDKGSTANAHWRPHGELGHGYREHIYRLALDQDLVAKGHRVGREVAVMVYFRGRPLARQTIDMIVDDRVVVEVKSTPRLHPDAARQLFGYLCATDLEVGLVLHFGPRPAFHRVICENRLKRRMPDPGHH